MKNWYHGEEYSSPWHYLCRRCLISLATFIRNLKKHLKNFFKFFKLNLWINFFRFFFSSRKSSAISHHSMKSLFFLSFITIPSCFTKRVIAFSRITKQVSLLYVHIINWKFTNVNKFLGDWGIKIGNDKNLLNAFE